MPFGIWHKIPLWGHLCHDVLGVHLRAFLLSNINVGIREDRCFHALLRFNHLIRSHQHIRRDRQADLLSGFQIDDELKLHWLLDG